MQDYARFWPFLRSFLFPCKKSKKFQFSSDFLLRNKFLSEKWGTIDCAKNFLIPYLEIRKIEQDYARLAKILANLLRIKSLDSFKSLLSNYGLSR